MSFLFVSIIENNLFKDFINHFIQMIYLYFFCFVYAVVHKHEILRFLLPCVDWTNQWVRLARIVAWCHFPWWYRKENFHAKHSATKYWGVQPNPWRKWTRTENRRKGHWPEILLLPLPLRQAPLVWLKPPSRFLQVSGKSLRRCE